jgi:hypothetical protein
MSERIETGGVNRTLIGVVILLGAVIVAGGAYLLFSGKGGAPEQAAPKEPAVRMQVTRPDEPVAVTVYIPSGAHLAPEIIGVKRRPDTPLQAREALAALLAGQRAAQVPVLRDLRLRAFFLDASGTAFADLQAAAGGGIIGSAGDELLAIYALVNTLTQNFEEIKEVRILLDSREAQTLAGHVDLTTYFTTRTDLVKQ